MLNLKSFFQIRSIPEKTPKIQAGYYSPLSAEALLETPQRQRWLAFLRDSSPLPKAQFRHYYQQPLMRCLTLMQQFPLTAEGTHARSGGMADYMLESLSYAVRLAKGHMFPPGAPLEEQAAQSTVWHAVMVYAAMLSLLGYLCDVHVELANGKRWFPLDNAPPEPYRFRFLPAAPDDVRQSAGAMLAWRLIPAEAIQWLNNYPDAFRALSLYLSGFREQTGVVHHIIFEAVQLTTGMTAEKEKPVNVSEAPEELPDNPGGQFWQWLATGCQHGEIAVNETENSVHLTGGYLFLPSPWIFRQYLITTGGEPQEKDAIQKAFERLRYHRQNSGKMVTCHLYQTEDREGPYRKLSGYLVPAGKVFSGGINHGDNPLLAVI
ncbi:TraI domain-containing protein [Morganella morganii]|uniref:TraI domain-containing protein n=1 Tax=Morganella morganii TaxID=582 RepID=UPI0034D3D8A8